MITTDGRCTICGQSVPLDCIHSCAGSESASNLPSPFTGPPFSQHCPRCWELQQTIDRLREANRRLQAEGPALQRDKLIVELRSRLQVAEDALARLTAEKVVLFVWKCRTCGCLWRDTLNGFVSLFPNHHSCQECEMKPTKDACALFALNLAVLTSRPSQTGEPT
jgi:hypothetical protein